MAKTGRGARLLSLAAVAGRLGVSTRTVQRLIKNGALATTSVPNTRRTLISEADVERLIAAGQQPR
jgi:excisionase family DNA binding protein